MDVLPNLTRLKSAEKSVLIVSLWHSLQEIRSANDILTTTIKELQGRLAQNSQNSSRPPSGDGLKKPKTKSNRQPSTKPAGGQKGHLGHSLKQVQEPTIYCARAKFALLDFVFFIFSASKNLAI